MESVDRLVAGSSRPLDLPTRASIGSLKSDENVRPCFASDRQLCLQGQRPQRPERYSLRVRGVHQRLHVYRTVPGDQVGDCGYTIVLCFRFSTPWKIMPALRRIHVPKSLLLYVTQLTNLVFLGLCMLLGLAYFLAHC